MSWKFAGIIINGADDKKVISSFGSLKKTNRSVSLSEALKTSFGDYAIGKVSDTIVIINHTLPYDSEYGKKAMSQLDRKLAALSEGGQVLCFILDGVTATYGMSFFRDGEKVRSKKSISGHQPVSYGPMLPEESDPEIEDEEALIFELMSKQLGQRVEQMIFDDSVSLSIYKES